MGQTGAEVRRPPLSERLTPTPERVEALAREFSEVLLEEVGDRLAELLQRNAYYKGEGINDVCASHEFCDSNMCMLAAATNLDLCTADEFMDYVGYGVCDLVNQAWDMANKKDFFTGPDYELSRAQRAFADHAVAMGFLVDYTYSGRMMFGRRCPAVVCPAGQFGFKGARQDQMGREVVVYMP